MSYIPPSLPVQQSAWPTLGELIEAGTRVVNFVDYIGDDGTTLPYISEEFENVRLQIMGLPSESIYLIARSPWN